MYYSDLDHNIFIEASVRQYRDSFSYNRPLFVTGLRGEYVMSCIAVMCQKARLTKYGLCSLSYGENKDNQPL